MKKTFKIFYFKEIFINLTSCERSLRMYIYIYRNCLKVSYFKILPNLFTSNRKSFSSSIIGILYMVSNSMINQQKLYMVHSTSPSVFFYLSLPKRNAKFTMKKNYNIFKVVKYTKKADEIFRFSQKKVGLECL